MLYFIGLGLSDEKDITVRGLEVVKRAERVYLESYTAILMVGKEKLVRQILCWTFAVELTAIDAPVGGLLRPPRHRRRPRNGRVVERRDPPRRRQG
jgi:Tetrapyrrole (Corrin/Porphyrin) Methylases